MMKNRKTTWDVAPWVKGFFSVFLLAFIGYVGFVRATVYYPGSTLNPDCAPTDANCGVASGNLTNALSVTNGSTTSSLRANGLYIATSTSNLVGLFFVDSSGNVSASGTLQVYGTSLFSSAVTSTAELFVSSALKMAGNDNNVYQRFITDDSATYGDFVITQGSFDNSFGETRKNQSLRIGFNKNYGGGNEKSGVAAMGLDFESFYMQAAGDPVMELHLPSIYDTDGVERRPISLQYHLASGNNASTGTAHLGFNSESIAFGNTTGTQYANLSPTIFNLNGVTLRQNSNNFNWLAQLNAAGDSTVEIARVDSGNRVQLSPSGAQVYIPTNSLGALSIGTTSTYALVNIGTGGAAASSSGIGFQGDVNLYRSQADVLATDDYFMINQPASGDGLAITLDTGRIDLKLSGPILQLGCRIAPCTRAMMGVGGVDTSFGAYIDMYNIGLMVFNSDDGVESARFTPGGHLLINTTTDNGYLSVSGTAFINGETILNSTVTAGGLTTFRSGFISSASSSVNAGLQVSGALNASSSLLVGGKFLQTPVASTTIVGIVTTTGNFNFGQPTAVQVVGKYAYVVESTGDGIGIVDISDPKYPSIVGQVITSALDGARTIAVAGKYAYVGAYAAGRLGVIDISNPYNPVEVGGITSSTALNGIYAIYASGKYVYAVNETDNSLRIIDVSSSTAPQIVGGVVSSTALGAARSVYVSGRYAYVAARDTGGTTMGALTVVDISSSTAPFIAGTIMSSELLYANSVYVSGRYAYVASFLGSRALRIVDVSNPSSPQIVGGAQDNSLLDKATSVFVSGKYAYLTTYQTASFRIIDISSSTAPTLVGGMQDMDNLEGSNGVFVSGKYAYVAVNVSGKDGLVIIDIGGIDAPGANIGTLQSNTIDVSENLTIGNNAYISNALNVGWGGIFTDGALTVMGTSTVKGLFVSSTQVYLPDITSAGSPTGDFVCYGTGGILTHKSTDCTVSSERFKHDIEEWGEGLDIILALNPVVYKRNYDDFEEVGLIAEEVDQVDKHFVVYEDTSSTIPYSVDYRRLVIPLINAVKEQQSQIDGLLLSSAGLSSSTPRSVSEEELLYASNRPLTSALTYLVSKVSDGAFILKDFLAERVTAVVGVFEKIRTKEMEMTDTITGDIYCIRIANGDWQKTIGVCDATAVLSETIETPTSPPSSESAPSTPAPETTPTTVPETDTTSESPTPDPTTSFINDLVEQVQEEIQNTDTSSSGTGDSVTSNDTNNPTPEPTPEVSTVPVETPATPSE